MSGTTTPVPEAALRHCRSITRHRARNFYYGLKLLPEPKRSALYAIYAWMRRADDLVDDMDVRVDDASLQQAVETFRGQTDAAMAGRPPTEDPMWAALSYTAGRFPIRVEHLHDLLDGQLEDVSHSRYETFDDLHRYCYRVASTVGLVCIEVWGYDDDRAPELAVDRGIAFQLTNILRDFAQDLDEGRVYLPAEDFERHELTPEALLGWDAPERCRVFLDEQVARADSYYRRSASLDDMITAECRPTLWAMTSIYHGLLEIVRREPARIMLGPRVRLSSFAKAAIALKARWRGRGAPA